MAKKRARVTEVKDSATVDRVVDRAKRDRHMEYVRDGIVNQITGIGTQRGKVVAGHYVPEPLLDPATLEMLFRDNDLAATICTRIVEDALREGFSVKRSQQAADESDEEEGEAQDAEDPAGAEDDEYAGIVVDQKAAAAMAASEVKKIMDRWKSLQGNYFLDRGAWEARLFGGGGLIIGARQAGGGSLARPLDDEKVTAIEFLKDWDMQDLAPIKWQPNGQVESWLYTPVPVGTEQAEPVEVHHTRLIVFGAAKTTNRGRIRKPKQYFDDSVLQRVYSTLRSFDSMFASTDSMFADASQAVFKLQGLISSLAEADGSGKDDAQTRLQLLDLFRSSQKAIMLEAGASKEDPGEDFSVVERTTLGTLDKVMDKYLIRLATAAQMPLTILLGMSPAGMDATGEMDMTIWFNRVDSYRRTVLEPAVRRLIGLIATELGLGGEADWEIVWPELARPKPIDVATAENMNVTSVLALVQGQVVLPEEAALSLPEYAPGLKLTIDMQSRQKALKDGLKEVANRDQTSAEAQQERDLAIKKAGPVNANGKAPKKSERKTPAKQAKRQT